VALVADNDDVVLSDFDCPLDDGGGDGDGDAAVRRSSSSAGRNSGRSSAREKDFATAASSASSSVSEDVVLVFFWFRNCLDLLVVACSRSRSAASRRLRLVFARCLRVARVSR